MTSFNASHGGQQAHAWIITFMSTTGDVDDMIVNATNIITGKITVTERVKVCDPVPEQMILCEGFA